MKYLHHPVATCSSVVAVLFGWLWRQVKANLRRIVSPYLHVDLRQYSESFSAKHFRCALNTDGHYNVRGHSCEQRNAYSVFEREYGLDPKGSTTVQIHLVLITQWINVLNVL